MKQVDRVSSRVAGVAVALTCVTIAFGLTVSAGAGEQAQTIRQGAAPRITAGWPG